MEPTDADSAGEVLQQNHEDADGEGRTVVAINDPNQGQRGGGGGSGGGDRKGASKLSEKRVPDNERTTTPYMTKYERARVLGTRALQIRYVYFRMISAYGMVRGAFCV